MALPNSTTAPPAAPSITKAASSSKSASKKRARTVRRRGRAYDDFHSDEEIEREARSDSEDDSSVGSDSASETDDSETEPASEDVPPNEDSRIFTTSTSGSPDAEPQEPAAAAKVALNGKHGPFVGDAQNWSDMVADEAANGVADLPVIDFTDLSENVVQAATPAAHDTSQKKAPKPNKLKSKASPTPPVTESEPVEAAPNDEAADEAEESLPSTSRAPASVGGRDTFTRRPAGQSARQAYQQRLDKDPSFVPTVGEFWGHDERLLDKDLRSLSGWWRGRWQGRGRGFIPGMRGRGRGGFFGPGRGTMRGEEEGQAEEELPPIEKMWTHDGFEEMKARDERRRQAQEFKEQREAAQSQRGGFGGPSRGGRGSWVGGRGSGFVPTTTRGGFAGRGRAGAPSVTGSSQSDRIWYTQKPERMWTKQHEGPLYFDPTMKPRPGLGQGFKIRLPGGDGYVVRSNAVTRPWVGKQHRWNSPALPVTDKSGSDYSDVVIVVRMPTLVQGKEPTAGVDESVEPAAAAIPTPVSNDSPLPPVLLPKSVENAAQAAPAPSLGDNPPSEAVSPSARSVSIQEVQPSEEVQAPQTSIAQVSEPAQPPRLEPLTIPVFTPTSATPPHVAEPSPSYGSPYSYPPHLPPGIAMAQNGVPYEISTGRPVYLQPTPPPHPHGPPGPPMFSPRPYAAPFVPGHMHHHSSMSTPDYGMRPGHSRPGSINGFVDPSTGAPIFTPARQSTRIEIRAPSAGAHDGLALGSAPRPSPLRSAVAADTESASSTAPADAPEQPSGPHMMEPTMMQYNPYQPPPGPQYYYPEQYGYYMDPSMQPYPQYDMYHHHAPPGSEHQGMPPQGTVYY
jgi:hypothetical protein